MAFPKQAGPQRAGAAVYTLCAVAVALLGLAFAATPAASAGADPGRLRPALERWLDRHGPYPPRDDPPRIMLVDPAEALTIGRHATRFGGRLRGLYDSATGTIFLVRPWSAANPRDVGVLLHELVHHRQQTAKHWYCPQEQEWEAYKLQAAWLAEMGIDGGFYWPAILLESSCTPRDIHPD
jgi:hypothetical protein